MNIKNIFYDKKENIIYLYTILAILYIIIANIFILLNPSLILVAPLTGGLLVWTHLHTLGIVTPFFMGMGLYNIARRYQTRVTINQIMYPFLIFLLVLPFFLFKLYDREGSVLLSFLAFLVFTSPVYFIFVFSRVLWRIKKENRNLEFWIDTVSLYFLFQAVCFGLLLTLNLNYTFFRRSILHSIKLHSHSAIIGFWLLQYINMIYRNQQGANNQGEYKYLKYALISFFGGLFLWTSVHDRFSWIADVFYVLTGAGILFFILNFLRNQKKKFDTENYFTVSFLFILIAYFLAGTMLYGGEFQPISHTAFIYFYIILYGVFIYTGLLYFIYQRFENKTQGVRLAYILYLLNILVFIAAVMIENLVFIRITAAGMIIYFFYICYHLYKTKAGIY